MSTRGTVKSDDGTVIAFTRRGSGPPIVLVDGALCFRENGPSEELASRLASQFTVYTYDRRGRGESGDTQPYSIAREIDDLRAIVRQAGDSVAVFGASSGAVLAMRAAGAGLPIRKLVMYEPPVGVSRPGGPAPERAKLEIDRRLAAGDTAGAARYFLGDMLGTPHFFVAVMPVFMRRTWARILSVAATLPYDLEMLSDLAEAMQSAKAVNVPSLVVGGAKSPAYMQEAVNRLASAMPNARALLLPGQNHDIAAAAKELVPAMIGFLGDRAGTGRH